MSSPVHDPSDDKESCILWRRTPKKCLALPDQALVNEKLCTVFGKPSSAVVSLLCISGDYAGTLLVLLVCVLCHPSRGIQNGFLEVVQTI